MFRAMQPNFLELGMNLDQSPCEKSTVVLKIKSNVSNPGCVMVNKINIWIITVVLIECKTIGSKAKTVEQNNARSACKHYK